MPCKLELNNKQPFYLPGAHLEGKLNCTFDRNGHVESIKVFFSGREFANVKVQHETLFNTEHTVCFIETVVLKDSLVSKGKASYNFKIQIPHHLPSTYTGEYGRIKYELEGIVKITNTYMAVSHIVIDIFAPVDLKGFPVALHKSARFSDHKEVVSFCGRSGQVSSTVQVDKRVFLCGELISLNVIINNASGVRVRKLQASLMKSASCKMADGEYAISKKKRIANTKCLVNVGRSEEKSYQISLKVPDDYLVPNLKHSRLFKIKYWMHVHIFFPNFWHRPLIVYCQVYLGHIPVNI